MTDQSASIHATSTESEQRNYALNELAYHLKSARMFERLRRLFQSDAWLHIRVAGNQYSYAGYLADINVAWAALGESGDASDHGLSFSAILPDYIRLGLIASSVISLSNAPVNLLIAAGTTGCWSIEHVVAVADQRPSRVQQVMVLTGLLTSPAVEAQAKKLLRDRAFKVVLGGIGTIPVRLLLPLLPCLEKGMVDKIIDAVLARETIKPSIPRTLSSWGTTQNSEDMAFYLDEAVQFAHVVPIERREQFLRLIIVKLTESIDENASTRKYPVHVERDTANITEMMLMQFVQAMEKEHRDLSPYARLLSSIVPLAEDAQTKIELLKAAIRIAERVHDLSFVGMVLDMVGKLHMETIDRYLIERVLQLALIASSENGEGRIGNATIDVLAPYFTPEITSAVIGKLPKPLPAGVTAFLAALSKRELDKGSLPQAHAIEEASAPQSVEANVRRRPHTLIGRIVHGIVGFRRGRNGTRTEPDMPGIYSTTLATPTALPSSKSNPAHQNTQQFDSEIVGRFFATYRIASGLTSLPPKGFADPLAEGGTVEIPRVPTFLDLQHLVQQFVLSNTPSLLNALGMESGKGSDKSDLAAAGSDIQPDLSSFVIRFCGPALLLPLVDQLPDVQLCALVEDMFYPDRFPSQLDVLDTITDELTALTSHPELEVKLRDDAARIRGAVLRSTLRFAFSHNVPLAAAWDGLPQQIMRTSDLSLVLNYVLSLPSEPDRNQFTYSMFAGSNLVDQLLPKLDALGLIAPYLSGDQIHMALEHVKGIVGLQARRRGLEILAPYLSQNEVGEALSAAAAISDSVEQVWAFTSLIPDGHYEAWLDKQLRLMLQIEDGLYLGSAVADILKQSSLDSESDVLTVVFRAIAQRASGAQADALIMLARDWQGTLQDELVAAILALPAASESRRFSPRGVVLVSVAERIPDDAISRVWPSVLELPISLAIGDPESMGWHWSVAQPRAAAILALAEKLDLDQVEQAIEQAKHFYWVPREDIFLKLALHADTRLADRMCEITLQMAARYASELITSGDLFSQEGALVAGNMSEFRVRREVGCAEVLAALAPKLSPSNLERVIAQAQEFSNSGPRAWLPGKLAPYLSDEQLDRILPRATVAALEFVATEPTRFDLITELRPYIQRRIDYRSGQLRELVSKYFPAREDLVLTRNELKCLDPSDQDTYRQLFEKNLPSDADLERMAHRGTNSMSEDEKRQFMEASILTPPVGSHLDDLLVHLILQSPINQRVNALEVLSKFMSEGEFASIVHQTFDELLVFSTVPTDNKVSLLIGIVPFLDATLRARAVKVALDLSSSDLPEDSDVLVEILEEVRHDFARSIKPRFTKDKLGNIGYLLERNLDEERFAKHFKGLLTDRTRLLSALVPYLDVTQISYVVEEITRFPDLERLEAICDILPHASEGDRNKLVSSVVSMHLAIGPIWFLLRMVGELNEDQRHAVVPKAIAGAKSCKEASDRATALIIALSWADPDEKTILFGQAIEEIQGIRDELESIECLALYIYVAKGDVTALLQSLPQILAFRSTERLLPALVLFAHELLEGVELTYEQMASIYEAVYEGIQQSLGRERNILLANIANWASLIQLFIGNTGRQNILSSIFEICQEWHWG